MMFNDMLSNVFDVQMNSYNMHHLPSDDGIATRIVWITNYTTNEDFAISVPMDDPLVHLTKTSSDINEIECLLSNEMDNMSFINKIHSLDLSKLNLNELLLLLYRLQQKTSQPSVTTSPSTISSSSNSSSSSSSMSHFIPVSDYQPSPNKTPSYSPLIHHRQSSFTLSNIADVPKQLTTTLAKPIPSFHSQNSKHIHSPNDVVNKLLQTIENREKCNDHKPRRYSRSYTYQESQQHKAKVISKLLSSKSIGNFPSCIQFYH